MMTCFVRRTPEPTQTAAFYREVVGLPVMRSNDETHVFWAGETMVFSVGAGASRPPRITDRTDTTCIPVFRCVDLESVLTRVRAAGQPVINERQLVQGRLVYILDPSGNVTGFQERYRFSKRAEDREAFRRLDAGENVFAGVPPMPPDLYGLGWVVCWFENEDRGISFYRDVVGLPDSGNPVNGGGALLSLGPTVLLDAKGGGRRGPMPVDRYDASNLFVLQVPDLDLEVNRLQALGVQFVHQPFAVAHGRLAYFSDPEGQLIGLEQQPRPPTAARTAPAATTSAAGSSGDRVPGVP